MSVKDAHLPVFTYEQDHADTVEQLDEYYRGYGDGFGYACYDYSPVIVEGGYTCTNCDWSCDFFEDDPISGDELLTYQGKRIINMSVDLWHLPNVKPRHATAGIIKGSRIKLYGPNGPVLTVNRVGSLAGGGIVDYGYGPVEKSFTSSDVYRILMDGEN